ncbi:unnamed protein product [Rotaria socialis]|uniref:IF rod domain-containing protein n=1 Tax=Rotaria socialis TaxID=392032 RepID=A0A817UXS3_9BILA|nr:unnamed protein product [Rotaria socialis]CAF3231635.1 unnamed protein product [Rotaria socialis]CAF3332123.1 unnamed protein product [Rotaria socialis]CAF3399405.1 unnamed protein product [Rotaria socialis]CAF4175364.1 unnamed protein product [Rotaria socialis]
MNAQFHREQGGISVDYQRVGSSSNATESTYHSIISPRVTDVKRTRPFSGGDGVTTRHLRSIQTGGGSFRQGLGALVNSPGIPMHSAGNSNTSLIVYNDLRVRDKHDLVKLNDKFAQYVESVRFLEAQNRKLMYEIDAIGSRSGQGTSRIEGMYRTEMDTAKKLVGETRNDFAGVNAKAKTAEDECNKQKERYNQVMNLRATDRKAMEDLERRMAENEAQINLFRRRIADLEDEDRRYKAEARRLQNEMSKLQQDLGNERVMKAAHDSDKMALEEEVARLKREYEIELTELRSRYQTADLDISQFLDKDLVNQLRQIRNDFENESNHQRESIQSSYSLTVNELVRQIPSDSNAPNNQQQLRQVETYRADLTDIKNKRSHMQAQNEQLKNRVDDLTLKIKSLKESGSYSIARADKEIAEAKARLAKATSDFDSLASLKVTLEQEICKYRDLLESQNGLRPCVDRIIAGAHHPSMGRSVTGNSTSTTVIRRVTESTGSNGRVRFSTDS